MAKTIQKYRSKKHQRSIDGLNLVVAPKVRWSQLVEVLGQILKTEKRRIAFVFSASKQNKPIPPDSDFEKELQKKEKVLRENPGGSIQLSQALEDLYAGCPEIRNTIEKIREILPENRCKYLLQNLPGILVGCNCQMDVDKLKSIVWRLASLADYYVAKTLLLATPTTPNCKTIKHKADTPWTEAHKKILEVEISPPITPVCFQVE